MIYLEDIIPAAMLRDELEAGMVREVVSPDGRHKLYCYTPAAQYSRHWNTATCAARGLVVHTATHEVVARPLAKFFNYGDKILGDIDLDAQVAATDKMDGSLAILLPDGRLVSKGSFTSFVAKHASQLYRERYSSFTPDPELTYLFEAIFPDGRIVLDYGETDDLFLIGAVEKKTGRLIGPDEIRQDWPGPTVRSLPVQTLREALELPDRENKEGMVLHLLDGTDRLVKVKQDDYKQLHQIVTETSPLTLWEALAVQDLKADLDVKSMVKNLRLGPSRIDRALALGDDWEVTLSDGVPDEFHEWMRNTLSQLCEDFGRLRRSIRHAAAKARAQQLPRKELVAWLRGQELPLPWQTVLAMTSSDDGTIPASVRATLWREVRPQGTGSIGWGR